MRLSLILALLCLCVPRVHFGAEGRVPVHSLGQAPPYSIAQPGAYVLTHNISVSTGDVIIISASGVTLDLNGMTIESSAAGSEATGNLISLISGARNVAILNGRLRNGLYAIAGSVGGSFKLDGIFAEGSKFGVDVAGVATLDVTRVHIVADHRAMRISGEPSSTASVTHSVFRASCPQRAPGGGLGLSNFTHSSVSDNVATVGACSSSNGLYMGDGIVKRNRVWLTSDDGIAIAVGSNTTLTDNTAAAPDFALTGGQNLLIEKNQLAGNIEVGAQARLMGNAIDAFRGGISVGNMSLLHQNTIELLSGAEVWLPSDNIVTSNVIRGGFVCDTAALVVTGARNILDGNSLLVCRSIYFLPSSSDNSYKNNMMRGSALIAVIDEGTNNSNDGGNLCRTPCP